MKYFQNLVLLIGLGLSSYSFAGASSFEAEDLGDWLVERVRARVDTNTNSIENTNVATVLLDHRGTTPFRVVDSAVINLGARRPNNVMVHNVTLHLADFIEDRDATVLIHPLKHSFIVLQDAKSWLICDSFEGIHQFSCRPSSFEHLQAINSLVAAYVLNRSWENYRAVLQQFLSETEWKQFVSRGDIAPKSKGDFNKLKGSQAAQYFLRIVPSDISGFFQYLRVNKKINEEPVQLALSAMVGVSLVSKTSFERSSLPDAGCCRR